MSFDHSPENILGNMNNNTIQEYYDIRVDMETSYTHPRLENLKFKWNIFRRKEKENQAWKEL